MIPCNELRIGNYFLFNNQMHRVSMVQGNTPAAGAAAVGYEANDSEGPQTCASAQVQPVPLTDDLLQQAGFRYHSYFQFWQKVGTAPGELSEMDIDPDYNVLDFMRRPVVKKLASLHQLQNVYFFLKGEELGIEVTA
jgi:hypothetical protein